MDLENMKCNSKDKGKDVMKACKVGCIGCKMCEKACQFDAVKVLDNVAHIDYLYANIPLSSIEYERCDCKESKAYWNEIDLKEEIQKKRKHFE